MKYSYISPTDLAAMTGDQKAIGDLPCHVAAAKRDGAIRVARERFHVKWQKITAELEADIRAAEAAYRKEMDRNLSKAVARAA